ncbi:hypothetical protein HanRHA438_Chr06g0275401 [Helianthus annuus]|nr:hypothetical protein HanRHA438_Chr06g0275401 [Helianthus annuus]
MYKVATLYKLESPVLTHFSQTMLCKPYLAFLSISPENHTADCHLTALCQHKSKTLNFSSC